MLVKNNDYRSNRVALSYLLILPNKSTYYELFVRLVNV